MISRLYTFVAGNLIQPDEVNDEFNQLVNLLSGLKNDEQVLIKRNSAGSTFEVDNTGGGSPQVWRTSGTARVQINSSGQVESLLATGTAPFKVTSTTQVNNLNAATVGGQAQSAFARKVATVLEAAAAGSNTTLDMNLTGGEGDNVRLRNVIGSGADVFGIRNQTDALDLLTIQKNTPWLATFVGPVTAADATAASHLVKKSYIDAKKTKWTSAVFYDGVPSTTTLMPEIIRPDGPDNFYFRAVKVVYRNGTPTGNTVLHAKVIGPTGTEISSDTITISSGLAANSVATTNLGTPRLLGTDERIRLVVVTVGDHADITVSVQGDQELTD